MGFERVTAIIQGTKNLTDFTGTISNYETDVFRPIFDEIEKLSGQKYGGTLPLTSAQLSTLDSQLTTDIAFRVIGDHIRTLSFAIADGIQPSNEGRGYVLRRILRRAVRYGRSLGFHEPFFYRLVNVLGLTMGDVFPELRAKQHKIEETLQREEESFNRTLDKGIALFEAEVARMISHIENAAKAPAPPRTESDRVIISAAFAFRLYDEQGFPLDLTQLMARERGLTVDTEGFERLMEEQRTRARKAQKKSVIEVSGSETQSPTNFLGYEHDHTGADVEAVLDIGGKKGVVLNNSVLYAEMGGQVGDQGEMIGESGSWKIIETRKSGDTWVHLLADENAPSLGEHVTLRIDRTRRSAIERHHTVTHLLHWALHEVVSRDAVQKGSYVGPEKLTFDFSSAALTKPQVREVEQLVNEKISENAPVGWTEIPYAEAKQRAEIMQFFGDKYGERVRVVQIGGQPNELNGYSMELCGGTHVRATGEIGSFRILGESAIAAGIRRIEAIAGNAVGEWARATAAAQDEKLSALQKRKPNLATLLNFNSETSAVMMKSIDDRNAQLESLEQEVRTFEKENAKVAGAELQKRAATIARELLDQHQSEAAVVAEVADADGALLQGVVDAMKNEFKGPIFLVGKTDSRVDLVATVPSGLTNKFQAGALIQKIAPIVGGKGGGRPESARGAGSDASRIGEALTCARELLAS
jgi:alanyl-tRNA synthetase